ncbi:MAG: oligosaccharide repeat unit polymerase [Mariniflexile sp.]
MLWNRAKSLYIYQIIGKILLVIRIFCFLLFSLPILELLQLGETRDSFVIFSYIILIVSFSFCLFIIDINGGSLFKVYFVFCYLFLGIIPLIEYKIGVIYWGGAPLSDDAYLITNIVLIFSTIVFICFYLLSRNSKINKHKIICNDNNVEKVKIIFLHKVVVSAVSLICLFAMLKLNNFSLISLMLRGGELKDVMIIPRWQNTLIEIVARFIPIVSFGYCMLTVKGSFIFKFFLFIVAIMCASPFGMARFMVGTLYLPLIFIMFPKILLKNYFPFLLLSSVIFVFPFLEKFRNFKQDIDFNFIPNFDFFIQGHFDSYQSIVRVISEDFITYGWQFLGAILFFVPRFFWPDKPIGTGAQLAKNLNYDFINVSANIYAEGYANFGLVGCLLVASALGFTFSKADYWFEFSSNKKSISIYYYYLMLGFLTMFLRGDLMTAISTSVGLFVCVLIVKKLYLA